ncbi:MAG: hypothetical protein ACFFCP_10920 [Promethearchaeota archaeon]
MAKLEQPANGISKGGGIAMTGNPEIVIEEYLALVKEHLPESIAEDVISELRSYMLETAGEIGNGEITEQSAKKVVAKFGAPSEVAREYKYSMLPETIPFDVEESKGKPVEVEDYESSKKKTVTYSTAFLQSVVVAILWAIIITLASTPIGPIWPGFNSTIVLLFQLSVVMIVLGAITYSRMVANVILFERSYPEWSRIQRLLTLPDNYIREATNLFSILDVLASFAGFVITFTSNFGPSYIWFNMVITFPVSLLLFSKMIISLIRKRSLDPTKLARSEFAVTFGVLLLLDSSIIWANYMSMIGYYSSFWTPFVWGYTIIWGPVLLFQLVTRGQNLFWGRADSSTARIDSTSEQPQLSSEEIKQNLSRVRRFRNSTVARTLGWIVGFIIMPVYCTIVSEGIQILNYSDSIITMTLFLSPMYIIPILIYFMYRRFVVSLGKSANTFGARSRPEALVDLFISIALFFGLTFLLLDILFGPLDLRNLFWITQNDLGLDRARLFMVGFMGFYILGELALGTRVFADIMEFWKSKKDSSSELVTISSSLIIIAISLKQGADILSSALLTNPFSFYPFMLLTFPLTLYPFVLLLVTLAAFQTEATKLKLKEKKQLSAMKPKPNNDEQQLAAKQSPSDISRYGSNYPPS